MSSSLTASTGHNAVFGIALTEASIAEIWANRFGVETEPLATSVPSIILGGSEVTADQISVVVGGVRVRFNRQRCCR